MDYILKETVTDIRYTANLKFTEKIGDSIRTGNFNINLVDTILSTNISINGSNFANYGITAPFTTKTKQIDDSLVNNGGIVVYLNNDYELNIIAIPMCICGDETIGFFSMNAEITFPAFGFTAKFLIKLCPTIVRNPVPEQLVESYEDPILPLRNDRVGKDYTPEYGINYPSTNIKYKTTDSLYVNTKTSGDHGFSAESGFSAEILKPDYPRVPCYVNHLRVYTIPYEFEPLTTFRYDWSTVKSYLFDPINNKKEDIVYDVTDIITSPESTIVVSSNGKDYKATFQYYDVKQYIFKDADGYFKNKLIFEISQWSKEPDAKPLLNPLNISVTFGDNGNKLDFRKPTTDISFIIENTDIGFYGTEYVTTIDRIIHEQEWSENLDIPLEPETTLSGNKLIVTYHDVGFSAIKPGVADEDLTTTAEGTSVTWIEDKDDDYHVSPDWNAFEVAQQTSAYTNLDLSYTKIKLPRLVIDEEKTITVPANRQLAGAATGKVIYEVINKDENFYGNEYETISARLGHGLIETPLGGCHLYLPDPDVDQISGNRWRVTYDGLYFQDNYSGAIELQLSAAINDGTPHVSPDWSKDEVIYWTSAICSSETWAHNIDAIDPFTITYSLYSPSADEDRIHWLAKDREGYLGVGSAHVVINNPNVNYRTEPSAVKLIYNLPRNASAENFDDSTYTTDGNISFDILGVEVDHENSATNAYIKSWGVFTAIGYDPATITELTTVEEESEWWKYKKVIPDIYPYDDFINFSLYTLSNLEINGGRIGSKTLAARNVICNNGARLDSDILLASGCSITFNASINICGNISAESAYINNPPVASSFSGQLYISDYLKLGSDIHVPVVYTGENCQVDYEGHATIESLRTWENPEFANLKPIPTAEFVTTGTATARNGEVFGVPGTYTTAAYDALDLGNHEAVTFYPGKYYFNSISVDTDCTFTIHNGLSTEEDDNSIMIFVNNANFADRLALNEDCTNAFAFRLYYAGTNTMQFGVASQSDFGTLIAPSGTISLRNDAKWNGHIWAQNVILAQGAEVNNDNLD